MKITNHGKQAKVEDQILTGMIVNSNVLGDISQKWDKDNGLFQNKWVNIVGRWCVTYYNKYGKAPKRNIQGLFEEWADKTKQSTEIIDLIESFLVRLSDNYKTLAKEINPDFILDLAKSHFNKVYAQRMIEEFETTLENEGVEKFFYSLNNTKKIEIGSGKTVNLLNDKEAFVRAFDTNKRQCLVEYPGEAGYFLSGIFERDSLVAFMAPEKTGKSFWLLDVSFRALLQKRRVAVFQVGDLSQDQTVRRYGARITKSPIEPSVIYIPTVLEYVQGGLKTDYEEKKFTKGLKGKNLFDTTQKLLKKVGIENPLKLEVHSMNSISVLGVRASIENWIKKENWCPDVVVIDYADILAPIYGGSNVESRQQVNATWQGLRALSQDFHCCVVTATQTNADSYQQEIITRANYSEDKRKNAHVTAMLAINQDAEEKRKQLQRINIIQLRENYFSPENQLLVAGCLGIANPLIKSVMFDPKVKGSGKKDE